MDSAKINLFCFSVLFPTAKAKNISGTKFSHINVKNVGVPADQKFMIGAREQQEAHRATLRATR